MIKRELVEKFPDEVLSVFHSASAALEELRRNRYDIAIVDYHLSELPGLEFLEKLRIEDDRLAVILLAASDTDQLSERALKAGAAEFLVKENSFHLLIPHLIERLTDAIGVESVQTVIEEMTKAGDRANLVDLTVSTLSHEINNPLMAILGETELLLNHGYRLAPEINRKIKIIEESAMRIKTALDRLASIRKPTVKKTVSGDFIDLKSS